ncbi:Amidase signature enzyme [Mycena sanguinolenta]|uniref:Amidase signature enzyme n=1 Tax=Mycena sanguinolenta TaxID=230812 RepID=A0A8H6YX08_9AGAR|nr:Amidase signature enzyme [Mycena sanguinolenta]
MAVEHLKAELLAWQSALSAHDNGDFEDSLRLFEPIADTAKILVNVALVHERLGERLLAIENFTRAIELDKYLAVAYFQRGVSYFRGAQYTVAAQDFSDAQVMMRTNVEINYDILGLNYKLKLPEILFNKWLALLKAGNKREAAMVVQTLIDLSPPLELVAMISSTEKDLELGIPFSIPAGTLYRPSASRMQLLNSASSMGTMHETPSTPTQSTRRRRLTSLCTDTSDTASTLSPSIPSRKGYRSSISSTVKASILDDTRDLRSVVYIPRRIELNRVVGADMLKPMSEINSIPCAGVRISHGPLAGLMAWRFVIQLDGSGSHSIVTNFILDTGNKDSYIPPIALTALGYRGLMSPGAEVTVRIQGIKTRCIIAHPEDAGRVGLSFTSAGSLTYYFDSGLVAPVLYGEREWRAACECATDYRPSSTLLAGQNPVVAYAEPVNIFIGTFFVHLSDFPLYATTICTAIGFLHARCDSILVRQCHVTQSLQSDKFTCTCPALCLLYHMASPATLPATEKVAPVLPHNIFTVRKAPQSYRYTRWFSLALILFCVHLARCFSGTARAALPDLYEASIAELQAGLDASQFTSVDLIKAYFARIEEVNINGPGLRADNIATIAAEGMNTTAGSFALLGSIVPEDAGVVKRLRKAGAIILGKANLSEFAHFRGNIASGWSGRGGQGSNPYFPHADPCGSSSGSGIATAIGLTAVSLGTETDGSITCPTSNNNLAGIKPTVGLTSRAGVVPISEHQDTVGPMTRSMTDAAIVLTIIAGKDPNDNFTLAQPPVVPDFTQALNKNALKGKRIGVPRRVFLNDSISGNDPSINVAFEEALHTIQGLGATVVDPADLPSAEEFVTSNNETIVLNVDFKIQLNQYLEALLMNPSGVRSLADLIQFDNDNPTLEEPAGFEDQSQFIQAEATNGFDAEFFAALAADHELGSSQGIDFVLQKFNLDALVLPAPGFTTSPAGDPVVGYPIVTGENKASTPPRLLTLSQVPLGFFPDNVTIGSAGPETVYPAPGVPFGLSFLGTAFSEFDLIGFGYAYEQKTQTRLARKAFPAAIPQTQLKDVIGK